MEKKQQKNQHARTLYAFLFIYRFFFFISLFLKDFLCARYSLSTGRNSFLAKNKKSLRRMPGFVSLLFLLLLFLYGQRYLSFVIYNRIASLVLRLLFLGRPREGCSFTVHIHILCNTLWVRSVGV